jgi:urea transport system permease protein
MIRKSALLLGLVLALGGASRVRAQDAYALLASPSFDSIRQGVQELGRSGDSRTLPVISALQDGELFVRVDHSLFIRRASGFIDAKTGESAPDVSADKLKKVRLNNPVREAIDRALGSLRLFASDPAQRRLAADTVFHAHDPLALPALDRAIAAESDTRVRRAMTEARAAALLFALDTSAQDKLAAIAIIGARGGADTRAILEPLTDQPPPVSSAAAAAMRSIDQQLQFWSVIQSVYYVVSLGSVLLLAAAGLAITFGVMGVINMAHGEMVMLGAYAAFVVQQALGPAWTGISILLAVPAAFVVSGGLGIVIERTLIRWLYGRPLETLLATWGLSLVLQQAVRSIFGPDNRPVQTPGWMSGDFHLGGLTFTLNRLVIIAFAGLVLASLMVALRFTPLGLRMRAVTQNRTMAAAMGIATPWVDAFTFGLGSGVAGMAGVALSQIDNVSPNLGQSYIIDSFMVVVFGGVGNQWGTVLGALTLGIVNKFLEPFAGAVLGKIAVLVMVILFIQRKPRGLMPVRGRAAEA